MKKNTYKIVLATGIFYPAPGGPAIHARRIAEHLSSLGYKIVVVTYSGFIGDDNFPFVVRRITGLSRIFCWIRYILVLFKEIASADIVYAFDLTSAGIPSYVLAKIFRKQFLIRVGGDPIWERVVERNKRFISLYEYYEQNFQLVDRPILYKIIKMVLRGSDFIVVYSPFLRDFYIRFFGIPLKRFVVIPNPYQPLEKSQIPLLKHPVFLFAGRFVAYKNLIMVIDAFNEVWKEKKHGELRLIGSGPDEEKIKKYAGSLPANENIVFLPTMNHEFLFDEIRSASVSLAPALTEYSPNFILESVSLGKPALVSSNHGMVVDWPEWLTFDPYSKKELIEKIKMFYDEGFYKKAQSVIYSLKPVTTWDEVLVSHEKVLKNLIK